MNKIIKIFCIVLIAFCIIFFLIVKLPMLEDDSRLFTSQVSESVREAKHNKVFINEYDFYPKEIIVENKKYKIEDIWIEKCWRYKDTKNEGKSFWNPAYTKTKTEDLFIEKTDEKQMVLIFNPKLTEMNLGVSKDSSDEEQCCSGYGYFYNVLSIPITEKELSRDSLTLYLFENNPLKNKSSKFITELKLVKKK